ncbi:MAG: DUF2721 domain-containing protein [Bdellovibrionota bacterium]
MTIDATVLTQNPFAVITIIAAPAILTNASSILSLSTSTRLIRCLDRINHLTEKLDKGGLSPELMKMYMKHIDLSHRQSRQFLRALRSIYTSLASFALASFIALVGAALATTIPNGVVEAMAVVSFFAGGVGAVGFVWASIELIKASKITITIMNTDIDHLKRHHGLLP